MILVDNSDITEQHNEFLDSYATVANAPLVIHDFIAKSFPKLEERAIAARLKKMKKAGVENPQPFPYEVKIPKSDREMNDGDFTPAKVITITEPIKGPYSDIWFGDTTNEIFFRWGYVNGDSRKISTNCLGDKFVHGFLGGATGTGKSVTMNSIIFGACMEYPPWELKLTLSDAKIVEFKTIATSQPMPHIDIVAATSDVDYMLSMLEKKKQEMDLRQSVFTAAAKYYGEPIKNIMEFRAVSGLCMPRCLMIFDECTAMFQSAGKRATAIAEAIDNFVRLGRNAGFHLLLASQEISSDIPNKTMANMTLRGAMGCSASVSEKLLGNDEAVINMGQKGKLITNTEADQKESRRFNVSIRVPWLPPKSLNEIADCTIKLGKEMKVARILRFYDEEERLFEDKYRAFVDSFEKRDDRIILGPPSFIVEGNEQTVQIRLTGMDIENICILANQSKNKIRAVKMLMANFEHFKHARHVFLKVDPDFVADSGIEALNPAMSFDERTYEDSKFVQVIRSTIYQRMLVLNAEPFVFQDGTPSEVGDEAFYASFAKGAPEDTIVNRVRFKYYMHLMQTNSAIRDGLQIDTKNVERMQGIAKNCLGMCLDAGCDKTPMTKDKFNELFCWILGMDRLIKIERDSRNACVEDLKKLMMDAYQARVVFIVVTSTIEDSAGLISGLTYYLLEDASSTQLSRIKARDCYPEKLSSGLMVLINSHISDDSKKALKFKKMMMKGEL